MNFFNYVRRKRVEWWTFFERCYAVMINDSKIYSEKPKPFRLFDINKKLTSYRRFTHQNNTKITFFTKTESTCVHSNIVWRVAVGIGSQRRKKKTLVEIFGFFSLSPLQFSAKMLTNNNNNTHNSRLSPPTFFFLSKKKSLVEKYTHTH